MSSTTISLERSAYELLKSRKRRGESFSGELHRLLGTPSPEIKGFLALFPERDSRAVADAIDALRAKDLEIEQRKMGLGSRRHGRRS